MSDFPQRLKQLRLEYKLTQQELANILDVSQNAVYNWENGKRQPRLEQIRKISEFFSVPLYELLDDLVNFCDSTILRNEEYTLLASLKPGDVVTTSDIQEQKVLSDFRLLNNYGKTEAIKRVEELTEIRKYTVEEKEALENYIEFSSDKTPEYWDNLKKQLEKIDNPPQEETDT